MLISSFSYTFIGSQVRQQVHIVEKPHPQRKRVGPHIRCAMTTHGFSDVPKDVRVMRTLVKEAEGNLGVYAIVEEAGQVGRGDPLIPLD